MGVSMDNSAGKGPAPLYLDPLHELGRGIAIENLASLNRLGALGDVVPAPEHFLVLYWKLLKASYQAPHFTSCSVVLHPILHAA
jgi:hypothetical protein